MLITSCLAITTDNLDWGAIDLDELVIKFDYFADSGISAKVEQKWDYTYDKLVLFDVSSFNQQELVNTLRKRILRSKEMYLIDSISLYQTIRYPIQLNIF